jgi:hypothetical protein
MDFDEWTPIGRGDPLKNDPTFDYSPPMVSKVKYWINPLHRTPDPPLVPRKESSTEFNQQYTATMTNAAVIKQPMEIKRFYQDYSDPSSDASSYAKINNKLQRPQQVPYQNHYFSPTRQPPLPLPMLVPPPPFEPNSYLAATKIENSTILELSWDVKNQSTTELSTTSLRTLSTISSSAFTIPATKVASTTTAKDAKTNQEIGSEKSVLQNLLVKEKSGVPHPTNPTTVTPLTPNPQVSFAFNKPILAAPRPVTHLIIQGHSKVKKYGGSGKLDKLNNILTRDVNDINDVVKYELPRDARGGKQLSLEDFLPINGALRETLKDIATNQAEGSGIGAELTKALFPSYVRPSTTLVYESPRLTRRPRHYVLDETHTDDVNVEKMQY